MLRLASIDPGDALFVVRNMREADKHEIYATRWNDNPNNVVDTIMQIVAVPKGFSEMGWHNDKPVAIYGAFPTWPGCYNMWMLATDDLPKIGFALTRHIIKTIIPGLVADGMHRMEARSHEGHTISHRWLNVIGCVRESEMRDCGRDRETFCMYAWRISDHAIGGA